MEYGFPVFRQANESTSIAADYNGNILAWQHNYFDTDDRVMMADVPVQGIRTVYGAVGDWFMILVGVGLIAAGARPTVTFKKHPRDQACPVVEGRHPARRSI